MYRKTIGRISLAIFGAFLISCFVLPCILRHGPTAMAGFPLQAPNRDFWLGTNDLGQDILSRVLYGGQNSIVIGILGASISTFIGTLVGMISGYFGGKIDQVLSRLIDVLMTVPVFPLVILLSAYFSPSMHCLGILMGVLGWCSCARIVRSQTLTISEWNFVQGIRAMGAHSPYILIRYIFPFVIPLSVVKFVFGMQGYLLMGVGLGFLGLGDANTLDWGQMLHQVYSSGGLVMGWWWWVFAPIASIILTSVSIAMIGYGLEQQFDSLLSYGKRWVVEK